MPVMNRRKQFKPRNNPIGRKAPSMRQTGSGTMAQRHVSGPVFHKIRLKTTATGTFTFRGDYLLAACGVVSTAVNGALILNRSARVKYCRVNSAPPIAGQISTVRLEFAGGNNSTTSARDLVVNTSNNPQTGATVYAVPKTYSQSSDFFDNSTFGPLIMIDADANAIIEIGLLVMQHEQGSTLSPATIVGSPFVAANKFYRYMATLQCEIIT